MKENLNWAVLGTGVIANEMAQALQKMGKRLYAVGNRTHEKPWHSGKVSGGKGLRQYRGYVFDEKADIIYITSPHNTHYTFIKEALKHGKHVLAENPLP